MPAVEGVRGRPRNNHAPAPRRLTSADGVSGCQSLPCVSASLFHAISPQYHYEHPRALAFNSPPPAASSSLVIPNTRPRLQSVSGYHHHHLRHDGHNDTQQHRQNIIMAVILLIPSSPKANVEFGKLSASASPCVWALRAVARLASGKLVNAVSDDFEWCLILRLIRHNCWGLKGGRVLCQTRPEATLLSSTRSMRFVTILSTGHTTRLLRLARICQGLNLPPKQQVPTETSKNRGAVWALVRAAMLGAESKCDIEWSHHRSSWLLATHGVWSCGWRCADGGPTVAH